MTDLISKQAAIDGLEERIKANGYSNVPLVSELNRSIGYIMNLQTAYPVKHGKWTEIDIKDYKALCSECGTWSPVMGKFCFECGARMDGE